MDVLNGGSLMVMGGVPDPFPVNHVQAKSATGLKLTDDSGTLGVTINDGGPVVVGASFSSSHALASLNDLGVKGKLEVDGTIYADNTGLYAIDAGAAGYIRASDYIGAYFYNSTRNRGLVCASGVTTVKYDSGGLSVYTDKITFNMVLHFPVYDDAGRPAAGTAGRVIYNTTDGNLNIDNGTNWILPDGTVT
jgi:hypothetical protein